LRIEQLAKKAEISLIPSLLVTVPLKAVQLRIFLLWEDGEIVP
jgi:hypothetical protein